MHIWALQSLSTLLWVNWHHHYPSTSIFGIKYSTKVDMPLNKETELYQLSNFWLKIFINIHLSCLLKKKEKKQDQK